MPSLAEEGLAFETDGPDLDEHFPGSLAWYPKLERVSVADLQVCVVENNPGEPPTNVKQDLPPVRLIFYKDHRRPIPNVTMGPEIRREFFERLIAQRMNVNICRGSLLLETRTIWFPDDIETYKYIRSGRFFVDRAVTSPELCRDRSHEYCRRGFELVGWYDPRDKVLWRMKCSPHKIKNVTDPNKYFLNNYIGMDD
jgi:hypothetical protein